MDTTTSSGSGMCTLTLPAGHMEWLREMVRDARRRRAISDPGDTEVLPSLRALEAALDNAIDNNHHN